MSKVDVLLGLQWGDEGKGKAVDFLAPKYDVVARFQGGPNAGHTLEFDGKKHVLHQIPSGIFHPDIINVIGNGVVIDPIVFAREIRDLEPFGVDATKTLILSNKAQLILPTHKLLDKALELSKGEEKIGSTLRGIGPTYQDKIGRHGLRIGDIIEKDFDSKYQKLKKQHLSLLSSLELDDDFKDQEDQFFQSLDVIRKFRIMSTEYFINESLRSGKDILAEGAQGTLLDIDFGSYPFVTSSNTTTAGACTGLGIAPNQINEVFGIFKAYCTRVGGGPFPTELFNQEGDDLRKMGNEFGATTGRPRRCGWLDIPALNYACMLNGVTQLFMMKADVLSDVTPVKICESYNHDGDITNEFPYAYNDSYSPIFEEVPSWNLHGIPEYKSLPDNLHGFIQRIEGSVGVPITLISLGPDRKETVLKKN
ncbi:Adenylosuccinate synthetase [Ekhidna lutea]|uniref:Adenylosuccinate synthetase n=1 Tax=Ekhidna lutea TaxID=447679 RepID=A0A239K5S8_EKHLU|nr:adenylosuccinate synthase [Ekhidna lutea]SNT13806.1 Adenylosuccinate synthetase [Ekhidna lutea]